MLNISSLGMKTACLLDKFDYIIHTDLKSDIIVSASSGVRLIIALEPNFLYRKEYVGFLTFYHQSTA